jgi:Protein of unknown function with HXXEE motif
LTGRWLWLFPTVFAVHVVEEGLAGEGFGRWIRRVSGREVGAATFFAVNFAFEVAIVAVVRRATRRARPADTTHDGGGSGTAQEPAAHDGSGAWVAPALGVIGVANGLGHLVGSAVTRSYSPGAVSGAGLWAPLGLVALRRSRRTLARRDRRRGLAVGVLVSAGVVPLALALSRPSGPARPRRDLA